MKALLLKDLYTLKESRILLLVMTVVAAFMAVFGGAESTSFIISYMTVITAVLVLNTMSYDEVDNGYSFLFTLPVSRKKYVTGKYIFGLATGLCGWLIAIILGAAVGMIGKEVMDWESWGILSGGALALLIILQSLMIPIQLKFGGQKGKVAILVILAAVAGGGVTIGNHVDLGNALQVLAEMSIASLSAIVLVVVLVILRISYICSVKIIEKKEF